MLAATSDDVKRRGTTEHVQRQQRVGPLARTCLKVPAAPDTRVRVGGSVCFEQHAIRDDQWQNELQQSDLSQVETRVRSFLVSSSEKEPVLLSRSVVPSAPRDLEFRFHTHKTMNSSIDRYDECMIYAMSTSEPGSAGRSSKRPSEQNCSLYYINFNV